MLSKEDFRRWFNEQVLQRWPRCDFNDVQAMDWHWRLKMFDEDELTEAVRRHSVRDEPRRPSLKAVYELALRWRETSGRAAAPKAGVPEATTYVQCVALDENGRGPLGWFDGVLLWPPHHPHAPEVIERAARKRIEEHKAGRGGVWEIVHNTTEHEIRVRGWKLTGQYDRICQIAAKLAGGKAAPPADGDISCK